MSALANGSGACMDLALWRQIGFLMTGWEYNEFFEPIKIQVLKNEYCPIFANIFR